MTSRAELQNLVTVTIKGDAGTMALINSVYDNIPENPWGDKNNYVSFGSHQKLRDDADCIRTGEHFLQLDVWSRTVGKSVCQKIVDRLEALFLDAELSLAVNALVLTDVQSTDVFKDADGKTTHGVVIIRAVIEERSA